MNPELKTEWLAALASGKYKHGKYALCRTRIKDETEYCCLGVLCEILSEKDEVTKSRNTWDMRLRYNGHVSSLPIEIQEKYNIQHYHCSRLANINDKVNTTDYTKQIKYIQDNL